MKKDWVGDTLSVFTTMGSSNYFHTDRQTEDYYATDPKAVRFLLELEKFKDMIVWECACGEGHLSKEMVEMGFEVFSTDLIDKGFGDGIYDFLEPGNNEILEMNIITNPPFRYTNEFVRKGISILATGYKMALFLPIRYLEGKERKQIFKQFPPKKVLVASSRINCSKNGEFETMGGTAIGYAWFIWEKGFKGKPTLEWFN